MSVFGRSPFIREPVLAVGFLSFSLLVPNADVSAREYSYDLIDTTCAVSEDASMTVEERQVFRFEGEYHSGWRNIPKRGFSGFRALGVYDEKTGETYAYSPKRLDRTDPSSWGKYTSFTEGGEEVIEWYYDARDETRGFVLRYGLDGVVAFHDDHDELYWNILTDYSVPIAKAGATVVLPREAGESSLSTMSYVAPAGIGSSAEAVDGRTIRYVFSDIPVGGDITIAPGWPRGIVSEDLYRRNVLLSNLGYILSALVAFLVPIILLLRWYFTERHGTGRGTIVPQYEPPRGLRPAMAELVMHERFSTRTWPATIVDLAVRGYLSIEEIPPSKLAKDAAKLVVTVAFLVAGAGLFFAIGPWVLIVFLLMPLSRSLSNKPWMLVPSQYVIRQKDGADPGSLEDYEHAFLDALFEGRAEFSTKEMKRNPGAAQALAKRLRDIGKTIATETAGDTNGYARDFRIWNKARGGLIGAGFVLSVVLVMTAFRQWVVFPFVLLYGAAVVALFVRYNPRLNRDGQILREEWFGFRIYLATAEKFRLQDLTPETFERFLPYAIIFGVEKQWARAFEPVRDALRGDAGGGMGVGSPSWYSGGSVGTFSPTTFSASFASSFASAFSNSSGGGASGGGGSAGGGGGGGGGGAG